MDHFILINDVLVKPQSPVLFDDRVSTEIEDFIEAMEAIVSHICPQFYMLLGSYNEMLMVHSLRFPIAAAQKLKKEHPRNASLPFFIIVIFQFSTLILC